MLTSLEQISSSTDRGYHLIQTPTSCFFRVWDTSLTAHVMIVRDGQNIYHRREQGRVSNEYTYVVGPLYRDMFESFLTSNCRLTRQFDLTALDSLARWNQGS